MKNNTQTEIGPVLAVFIILGLVLILGVVFYKSLVDDLGIKPEATIDKNTEAQNRRESELYVHPTPEVTTPNTETTKEEGTTTKELDEELLDFEDLEHLDLDI